MIKNVQWTHSPSSMSMYLSMEVQIEKIVSQNCMPLVIDKIVEQLAAKFVEQHGDEILKAIHEKTVDAKVIAKVVANLRKELSEPK